MTEQPQPAPGWYPNSVPGQEQWWDGTGWRENTRQAGGTQPQTLEARRAYWTGWSRDASLIVGILLAVLSIPAALGALVGLFSLPAGIFLIFLWLMCAGGAVALFINYGVRGKQLAAARAAQPGPAANKSPE